MIDVRFAIVHNIMQLIMPAKAIHYILTFVTLLYYFVDALSINMRWFSNRHLIFLLFVVVVVVNVVV